MAMSRLVVLAVLLLALAAQQGLARRHHKEDRKHREPRCKWERSEFCRRSQCPQFCLEKEYDSYEVRTYRQARWVTTSETDEKYEIAYLKATQRLKAYLDGKNDEYERMRRTTPIVSELSPGSEGQPPTARNYTFAMYLPDRYQGRHGHRIPRPLDPSLSIEKWEKDTLYVRSFPGFATEATIMNQVNALMDMLEEDDRDYEEERVWVAVYDPAYRLTDRHNEVLMEASRGKKQQD